MFASLYRFISGIFVLPDPVKSFDDDLGAIESRIGDSDDWVFRRRIRGEEVEIHLEGSETAVESRSKDYFLEVENRLAELWQDVIDLTIEYSKKYGFYPNVDDFRLESVLLTPISELENGQLCFFFAIAGDPDGSYFVPLDNEKPIYVHRDT